MLRSLTESCDGERNLKCFLPFLPDDRLLASCCIYASCAEEKPEGYSAGAEVLPSNHDD